MKPAIEFLGDPYLSIFLITGSSSRNDKADRSNKTDETSIDNADSVEETPLTNHMRKRYLQ